MWFHMRSCQARLRLAVGRKGVSSQLSSWKFVCFGCCLDPLFQPPSLGFCPVQQHLPFAHTAAGILKNQEGKKKMILAWVSDSKLAVCCSFGSLGGLWVLVEAFPAIKSRFPPPSCATAPTPDGASLRSPLGTFFLLCSADRRWQEPREPQFLCQICWETTKTSRNDRGGRKQRSTPRTHSMEFSLGPNFF